MSDQPSYREQFVFAQARLDEIHALHYEARRVNDPVVRRSVCERAEEEFEALSKVVHAWKTLLMYMILFRAEQLYREMQQESRHE
mgnify:CR=1 FL=1